MHTNTHTSTHTSSNRVTHPASQFEYWGNEEKENLDATCNSEDELATVRQSSPRVLSESPVLASPSEAVESELSRALREVAVALSTSEDVSDPFAALRPFSNSPGGSSAARPDVQGDAGDAELIQLLLREVEGGGSDGGLDPLMVALEKMYYRRASLEPNWKPTQDVIVESSRNVDLVSSRNQCYF